MSAATATIEIDRKNDISTVYVWDDEFDAFVNEYCRHMGVNAAVKEVIINSGLVRLRRLTITDDFFDRYGITTQEMLLVACEFKEGKSCPECHFDGGGHAEFCKTGGLS